MLVSEARRLRSFSLLEFKVLGVLAPSLSISVVIFFDVIVTSSTVKNKFLSQRFKPRNYAKNIISHLILLKYITEIAINNPPVWTGWKKQKWKKV